MEFIEDDAIDGTCLGSFSIRVTIFPVPAPRIKEPVENYSNLIFEKNPVRAFCFLKNIFIKLQYKYLILIYDRKRIIEYKKSKYNENMKER